MGSGQVDIGALAPFAYVLAHSDNGARVLLKSSRKGALTYHAMFLARADSGIKSIEEAKGKRMAWVDAASASGYLFPAAYLKTKGMDPDTFFFRHDIRRQPRQRDTGRLQRRRGCVQRVRRRAQQGRKTAPRREAKGRPIGKTDEIPNDTFSVRKDLDPALAEKIKAALLKYAATPEGKKTLLDTYEIDGMAEAKDEDYEVVRQTARAMDIDLEALDNKPAPAPAPAAKK
jgi:phosphonate transport system substrate-binding protein